jgi:uncharacterized protein (TIGR00255 family)
LICSMTAFGRSQQEDQGYRVVAEVRALNSRNLDAVLRFPKNYLDLEDLARKQIARRYQRGRIEVFIQIEAVGMEKSAAQLNLPLARHYWEQLQTLQQELPGANAPALEHLLRFPDLFQSTENEQDRNLLEQLVTAALDAVLDGLDQMRADEGQALVQDLRPRLAYLAEAISRVEARKGTLLSDYQQRLRDRLQELLGNLQVDEDRLLQELAVFAERSDITEEIVRARSHLEQMQSLLGGSESAAGRKLDFLTQELHREVNTIGSKANDLEISQVVVAMKSEIAKVKEQIQNIE